MTTTDTEGEAVARKLREWAIEQDKSERAADEEWAIITHAETAAFFRKAADTVATLSRQLAEAQATINDLARRLEDQVLTGLERLAEAQGVIERQREALSLAADYIRDMDGGNQRSDTGWKSDELLGVWLKVRATNSDQVICPDCQGERRGANGHLCARCKGCAQIHRNKLRPGETAPFEHPTPVPDSENGK